VNLLISIQTLDYQGQGNITISIGQECKRHEGDGVSRKLFGRSFREAINQRDVACFLLNDHLLAKGKANRNGPLRRGCPRISQLSVGLFEL
jgi:hypothetical protein